jgi:hypothetical protein
MQRAVPAAALDMDVTLRYYPRKARNPTTREDANIRIGVQQDVEAERDKSATRRNDRKRAAVNDSHLNLSTRSCSFPYFHSELDCKEYTVHKADMRYHDKDMRSPAWHLFNYIPMWTNVAQRLASTPLWRSSFTAESKAYGTKSRFSTPSWKTRLYILSAMNGPSMSFIDLARPSAIVHL